ncbi:MAG: glycosyltransferase family 2 protein [Candidatus Eisenbacteria bacterium]|uniref:Glycosyltransferase family 2 protein n=1 Tax=Eiseniibacteriota bacterium TaxID=2212470 RepID=A0A9D6L739_UNCEI|nr:glycosyltransferase family 2 protein [Candidatus Eisenbacteria bacterium]MBI3538830.1 glycosyltransferase family 2 protein [Candidatus Eisenbacteria bacterium]
MIFVIFPAYNEENVIRPTLLALATAMRGRSDYRAVLVDDGSRDATVAEAERAVAESGGALPLTVLRHEVNRGLGAGLRTGIYWCLDRAGDDDVIVTLDADNTHPPAMIPGMVAALGDRYDLVVASRYRTGAEVHGVPGYRRALSDVGRLVFQALYPIPGVRDYTCCFRAFRVPILRRARAVYGDRLCTALGFEAVMDLLLRLGPLGVRVHEVGFVLNYGDRVGQSKMKVLKTIRSTLGLLTRRRIERMTRYGPRQIAALEAGAAAPRPAASPAGPRA